MTFGDYLEMTTTEGDRQALLSLGRRVYEAARPRTNTIAAMDSLAFPPGTATPVAPLEELMQRLRLAYRAARVPLPTPEELEAMVLAYFDAHG